MKWVSESESVFSVKMFEILSSCILPQNPWYKPQLWGEDTSILVRPKRRSHWCVLYHEHLKVMILKKDTLVVCFQCIQQGCPHPKERLLLGALSTISHCINDHKSTPTWTLSPSYLKIRHWELSLAASLVTRMKLLSSQGVSVLGGKVRLSPKQPDSGLCILQLEQLSAKGA